MAQHHSEISDKLRAFIEEQPMFFVATAAADGRVNLSPKGLDGTFKVLSPNRVAFLNLTGSGNETAAHLLLNNRITIMFCAFKHPPLILRLYGNGRAIHENHDEWRELIGNFADLPGKRQIIVVDVFDIISSCGYGVPEMDLREQRDILPNWAQNKGEDGIRNYWREKNQKSFDGFETGIPLINGS